MGQCFCEMDILLERFTLAPAKSVFENIHLTVHLSRAEGGSSKGVSLQAACDAREELFPVGEEPPESTAPSEQSHHQVAS